MQGIETRFLERIYDEAKALLIEARDYVQMMGPVDRAAMAPIDNLRCISEGLRLTTRLTEVMAWSLTQKAVQAGEITREEAAEPKRRLGGKEICLDEHSADEFQAPARLNALLRRSLSLYQRTLRLDKLMAGEEMQFGSFNICLAASENMPVPMRTEQPRFLLA
jgi:regulator of CtrA degradation